MGSGEQVKRSEANIQNDIWIALSQAGCLVWRNNTGVLKDKTGRPIKFGLCKGSSDLVGVAPDGRFLAVEVKTATGRIRPEQEAFIAAVKRNGGRAGIARNVQDALDIALGVV